MGVRFPFVVSNTIQNTVLVTTAETVVAISPPFSPSLDSAAILVLAWVSMTAGAASGACTGKLRRGTTTAGQLLQATGATFTTNTGFALSATMFYFDINPGAAGQQYCLTLTQGAATGNGTVGDVCIAVLSL